MKSNFTTREAVNYLEQLGIPFKEGTLEVWRSQGRGPEFKRIGRSIFYSKNALDRFAEGQTVKTIDSL